MPLFFEEYYSAPEHAMKSGFALVDFLLVLSFLIYFFFNQLKYDDPPALKYSTCQDIRHGAGT